MGRGSEVFTSEFYILFWQNIGVLIYRSLKYGYEVNSFSEFQYQCVITWIPMEVKNRRNIGYWRPISLLNIDMKIVSSIHTNRLKNVLTHIISDTQKSFMKDRLIGENTRLLYDLMHHREENDVRRLRFLINFEKNF